MKSTRPSDPARWRDAGADRQALEARAAALADAAKQSPPLAPQALARIRNEVVARRSGGRAGGAALWWLSLTPRRVAAGVLLVVCATTAVGAGVLWRRHVDAARPAAPATDDRTAPRAPQLPARPSRPAVADEPSEPVPPEPPVPALAVPSPTVAIAPRPAGSPGELAPPPLPPREPPPPSLPSRELAPPSLAPREPPPFPAATSAASAPPATASEAALVSLALTELRQRHDARAALAALDRHAREFPHGVLETEAFRTRVEATIQLGDLKRALALLDGASGGADLLGAELVLTRAELRAAAGRFREALVDFTELVDGRGGPLAAGGDERALYGRAVCLARIGEHDRARAALHAYRARFPEGRFAAEVARLLAEP